jgi:hypothetical protein
LTQTKNASIEDALMKIEGKGVENILNEDELIEELIKRKKVEIK